MYFRYTGKVEDLDPDDIIILPLSIVYLSPCPTVPNSINDRLIYPRNLVMTFREIRLSIQKSREIHIRLSIAATRSSSPNPACWDKSLLRPYDRIIKSFQQRKRRFLFTISSIPSKPHLHHSYSTSTRAKRSKTNKAITTKMSWMDSWSRPAKSQATPAPYYLLPGGEATPYCHSCGRVIGQRKQVQNQLNQHDKGQGSSGGAEAAGGGGTPVKYCSARCRGRKPGKLDREIEGVFLRFLLGKEMMGKDDDKHDEAGGSSTEAAEADVRDFGWSADKPKQGGGNTKGSKHQKNKKVKGDARILVSCSMVEDEMFSHHREQGEEDEDAEDQRPGTSSSQEEHEDDDHHHPQPEKKQPEKQGEELLLLPYNDPDLYDDALHPPSHHREGEEEMDGDVLARLSVRSGTRIRPTQSVSQVNGSVGGEKGWAERADETEESLRKRIAGQRRAREREMVRCAARRGVAFGFVVPDEDLDEGQGGSSSKAKKGGGKKHTKKAIGHGKHGDDDGEGDGKGGKTKNRKFCEAVMSGKVVEPSFAKGNWSIRWREE